MKPTKVFILDPTAGTAQFLCTVKGRIIGAALSIAGASATTYTLSANPSGAEAVAAMAGSVTTGLLARFTNDATTGQPALIKFGPMNVPVDLKTCLTATGVQGDYWQVTVELE